MSDSCSSEASCTSCSVYSTCHWCSSDSACHTIGSVYGCLTGATCDNGIQPSPSPTSDSCSSQPNCTSCNTYSTCHWCSFDSSCHTIGSVYGCLTGVSCYNIDSCFRSTPEPAPPLPASATVAAVVVCVAVFACCCASCWLAIARAIKVTFQELLFRDERKEGEKEQASPNSSQFSRVRVNSASLNFFEMKSWSSSTHPKKKRAGSLELGEDDDMSYDAAHRAPPPPTTLAGKLVAKAKGKIRAQEAAYGPLSNGGDEDSDDSAEDGVEAAAPNPPAPDRSRPVPPTIVQYRTYPKSPIDCVWNSCVSCYLLTILIVVVLSTACLVVWPQMPQYNLCSDELDWGSIVDGMTSAKAQASFEILLSVYNPNHFDLQVLSGTGTFHHDGVLVGTFDMGSDVTVIHALSITDVLLTVTFTTDQWQALELGTEYYKGSLTFLVDANVAFAIPAFKYTAQSEWHDYFVHVGEIGGDRSLCACKEW